jgi:two-component system chemotaxis response regulator CheY
MPTVLVVDDSAKTRKVVIESVQDAGFERCEFIEASDDAEALETLSKHDIDLILCSIDMTNPTCIRFVRRVRDPKPMQADADQRSALRAQARQRIPIVILSTEQGLETVQAALAAGANGYLKQPLTPDQLEEKLGLLLS